MTQRSKSRLLIADDQEVVRYGLKALLADTEIKVVAAVKTGRAAVKYVLKHDLDVVLMDVRMPDGDGMNALERYEGFVKGLVDKGEAEMGTVRRRVAGFYGDGQ